MAYFEDSSTHQPNLCQPIHTTPQPHPRRPLLPEFAPRHIALLSRHIPVQAVANTHSTTTKDIINAMNTPTQNIVKPSHTTLGFVTYFSSLVASIYPWKINLIENDSHSFYCVNPLPLNLRRIPHHTSYRINLPAIRHLSPPK